MFFLKRNLPTWERALRIAMGVGLFAATYGGHTAGIVSYLALASAITLVLTAWVGFCPACAMVGRRDLEK